MNISSFAKFIPIKFYRDFVSSVAVVEADLPFKEAGLSDDDLAYVSLDDGTTLYGHRSDRNFRLAYRLFTSGKFRQRVPLEAFQVVWDAWFRYWGNGILDQQHKYQLQPGDIAVEAGAYLGHYIVKMAKQVGPSGRVVAIEADEENLRALRKNVNANQLENVAVIDRGVWDAKGEISFYRTSHQKNSIKPGALRRKATEVVTIVTDTIDNILTELEITKADFVIITVNGAELEVLKGMSDTLARGCHLTIATPYDRDGRPGFEVVKEHLETIDYQTTYKRAGRVRTKTQNVPTVLYALPLSKKA